MLKLISLIPILLLLSCQDITNGIIISNKGVPPPYAQIGSVKSGSLMVYVKLNDSSWVKYYITGTVDSGASNYGKMDSFNLNIVNNR